MFRTDAFPTLAPAVTVPPTTLLTRLATAIRQAVAEQRTRRAIETLDPHLLRDIGIEAPVTDAHVRRILLLG